VNVDGRRGAPRRLGDPRRRLFSLGYPAR
jgi:hypothetical protein